MYEKQRLNMQCVRKRKCPAKTSVVWCSHNLNVSVIIMAWGRKQKEALSELFDKDLANPSHTKSDDIDPYYDLSKSFESCKIDRFRVNFRNWGAEYMKGKALEGTRRGESMY